MTRRARPSVALGLMLAVLTFAACSALDPTPPDPHEKADGGDPRSDADLDGGAE